MTPCRICHTPADLLAASELVDGCCLTCLVPTSWNELGMAMPSNWRSPRGGTWHYRERRAVIQLHDAGMLPDRIAAVLARPAASVCRTIADHR